MFKSILVIAFDAVKSTYGIIRKLFTGMESKVYSEEIELPTELAELDEDRLYNNGYIGERVCNISKPISHAFTVWMVWFFTTGIYATVGTGVFSLTALVFVVGIILTTCVKSMFQISKHNAWVMVGYKIKSAKHNVIIDKLDKGIEKLRDIENQLKLNFPTQS